jgi:hypothetical protein
MVMSALGANSVAKRKYMDGESGLLRIVIWACTLFDKMHDGVGSSHAGRGRLQVGDSKSYTVDLNGIPVNVHLLVA